MWSVVMKSPKLKTYADVVVANQDGTVVCVATHILKFFEVEGE